MLNYVILHGTGGDENSFWIPWLKSNLEELGYKVSTPNLPNPEKPERKLSRDYVLEQIEFNEDTILIGHSSGATTILSILESLDVTIKKAILVAGFYEVIDEEGYSASVLQDKYDRYTIKNNAEYITFINSDNDPWGCTASQAISPVEKLKAKLLEMKGEGHMGSGKFDQPYKEFPILLKESRFFDKPPLNIEQKISLLEERGLIIGDKNRAEKYLKHIGYFRMTGYFKYFQDKETDIFHEGTTFDAVLQYYIFDRKLRLLTLDAIEKIEVSMKSNISDYMCSKYGVFWYDDGSNLNLIGRGNKKNYKYFLSKIDGKKTKSKNKSTAIFIKEYYNKYCNERLPSRMLFEDLTIGEVVNLFDLLKKEDAEKIADSYSVFPYDLWLWGMLLLNLRNISAHHGRLWNRRFIHRPRFNDSVFEGSFPLEIKGSKKEVIPNFHTATMILNYLQSCINENHTWLERLELLIEEFPLINIGSMGFEKNRKESIKKFK